MLKQSHSPGLIIRTLILLVCVALSMQGNTPAYGEPDPLNLQKVTAPDGAAEDGFGYSAALSDDGRTALVGSYYIEFGIIYPIGPGGVYAFIYNDQEWVLQQKLPTPEMPEADLFGFSLTLSADGNTALVGAQGGSGPSETQVPGAAYVFTRNGATWTQQAMLTASDRQVGDHFGVSVALSDDGNTALIGAYVDDIGAKINQGSAYVFQRSGTIWNQQAHLTSSDGAAEDYFGRSVSLSGDGNTALIGADMKTIGGNTRQGAAYLFNRSGSSWNQSQQLTNQSGSAYHWFGGQVAISTDAHTVLVGSEGLGAVLVFDCSATPCTQQAVLSDPEGSTLGWGDDAALSPDGDTILVEDGYTFIRSGVSWFSGARLLADDAPSGYGSAAALSADGSTALVGACSAKVGDNLNQGAAYFFGHPVQPLLKGFLPYIRR